MSCSESLALRAKAARLHLVKGVGPLFLQLSWECQTGSMSTGQCQLRLRLGAVLSSLCCSLAGSMWHLQFLRSLLLSFVFVFLLQEYIFPHIVFRA